MLIETKTNLLIFHNDDDDDDESRVKWMHGWMRTCHEYVIERGSHISPLQGAAHTEHTDYYCKTYTAYVYEQEAIHLTWKKSCPMKNQRTKATIEEVTLDQNSRLLLVSHSRHPVFQEWVSGKATHSWNLFVEGVTTEVSTLHHSYKLDCWKTETKASSLASSPPLEKLSPSPSPLFP